MDEQQKQQFIALQETVTKLEATIEAMKSSSEFPYDISRALDVKKYIKAQGSDSTFDFLGIVATDYAYLSQTLISTEVILGIPAGFIQIIGGDADGLLLPVYLKPRTF